MKLEVHSKDCARFVPSSGVGRARKIARESNMSRFSAISTVAEAKDRAAAVGAGLGRGSIEVSRLHPGLIA